MGVILTLLLAGLLVVSGWMQATAAAQGAQGEVKADSGFQPKPNGFSFENWGAGQNPQGDLTAADAQCLFGDAVCERTTGGKCEPTPAARMWIEQMNKQMGGGHCEGLAALSAAFYSGLRQPQAYGGQTAYELKVDNAPVLRMISTIFVTQFLEPVQSATQKTQQMSTRQIVDTLMEGMKSRQVPYTLGIYGKDGGHAITPFAVEEKGNGRYLIHVYDNNYPGADNVVEVDTNADTWRYSGAALNPGEKAEPWEGKGGSMDLTTLSLRFEPLVCPFCAQQSTNRMCGGPSSSQGPAQQPSQKPPQPAPPSQPSQKPPQPSQKPPAPPPAPQGPTSVVTNANCDQLSVTDKSGRSASFSQGKMNSKIPGVHVSRIRGARGCVAQLPPGGQYNVSVTGKPGQQAQPFNTTVFRPGQVVSLSGCAVTAGHVEKLDIGDSSFGYTPGSNAKPTFAMATDNVDGKNGYYEVENVDLGAGHVFSLNENDEGQITFDSDDPDLHELDIKTSLEDENGAHEQDFDNVEFDDHGQAILAPNEEGELEYGMDTDSDGQINAKDNDDDNDGTPDAVDKDDDNDGTPDAMDEDSQEEEAPEAVDEDSNQEEAPEAVDEDSQEEGTPDAVDEDSHQEETPDAVDEDDGGDVPPDAVDEDSDQDGTPDAVDEDSQEEEAPDAVDEDSSQEGASDEGEESEDVERLPYVQVFGWQGDCSLHSAGLFAGSPSRFSQEYDLLNG